MEIMEGWIEAGGQRSESHRNYGGKTDNRQLARRRTVHSLGMGLGLLGPVVKIVRTNTQLGGYFSSGLSALAPELHSLLPKVFVQSLARFAFRTVRSVHHFCSILLVDLCPSIRSNLTKLAVMEQRSG